MQLETDGEDFRRAEKLLEENFGGLDSFVEDAGKSVPRSWEGTW
jgi:hypothetical protein